MTLTIGQPAVDRATHGEDGEVPRRLAVGPNQPGSAIEVA
jgi:hypothetical protein